MTSARVENRKRWKSARRRRRDLREYQVRVLTAYLGVTEEQARCALEWLFSDIPLDVPIEKRRRGGER